MIQWFDAALNKRLFSAALHAVYFRYSCIVKMVCHSAIAQW